MKISSLFGLVALLPPAVLSQTPFQCDVSADICPYFFDGACDAFNVTECEGGDCFDCDPCRQYNYDCGGCIANGCYWCPTEGFCSYLPITGTVPALGTPFTGASSCTEPEDWLSGSADENCQISTSDVFKYVSRTAAPTLASLHYIHFHHLDHLTSHFSRSVHEQ